MKKDNKQGAVPGREAGRPPGTPDPTEPTTIAPWRRKMNAEGIKGGLAAATDAGLKFVIPQASAALLGPSLHLPALAVNVVIGMLAAGVAAGVFEKGKRSENPKVRAASAWGGSITEAREESKEAFAEFVRRAGYPESKQALEQSLRAALDVFTPEICKCLGNLGRAYAATGQGPDYRFRQTAELLKHSCADDAHSFSALFDAIARSLPADGRVELIPIYYKRPEPRSPSAGRRFRSIVAYSPPAPSTEDRYNAISFKSPPSAWSESTEKGGRIVMIDDPLKALSLLKGQLIARDVAKGATMDLADARFLLSVFERPEVQPTVIEPSEAPDDR